MPRLARAATALVLVLAFATVPLAVDVCAASCEAAHSGEPTAAPACHHAASATARISHAPTPCGHDHHGLPVVASANPSVGLRIPLSTLARTVDAQASMVSLVATGSRASPGFDPSVISIPLALSFALRI
jgi:hypothetical protein